MNLGLFITETTENELFVIRENKLLSMNIQFSGRNEDNMRHSNRFTNQWTKVARPRPFSMWFFSSNLFFLFSHSTLFGIQSLSVRFIGMSICIVDFCYLLIWKTRTGATKFRYHFVHIIMSFSSVSRYHIIKCGSHVWLFKNGFGGFLKL